MDIFKLIKLNWKNSLFAGVILSALTFSVVAFMTPKYQADVSILIIQKQDSGNVDAFSAAKSAEYLSDIFSRVVYSNTFLEDVNLVLGGNEIQLPLNPEKRKKQWHKMLKIRKVNNTGIINATIYHQNQVRSGEIAQAIAKALAEKGGKYHGGGDRVKVELIDGPVVSNMPTKPNLWLNALVGFMFGFIGFLAWAYFKLLDGNNSPNVRATKKQARNKEVNSSEIKSTGINLVSSNHRKGFVRMNQLISGIKKDRFTRAATDLESRENLVQPGEESENEDKNSSSKQELDQIISQEDQAYLKQGEKKVEDSAEAKSASGVPPANLPVMEEEKEIPSAAEIANGYAPAPSSAEEASDEEVKERLNKLLKGDF